MPDRENVIRELEIMKEDAYVSAVHGLTVADALEALRANGWKEAHSFPEIVRCKDCKNAEVLKWLDNAIICKKHSYTGVRPDEFYCADGERSE